MLRRIFYTDKDLISDIQSGGRAEDRAITFLLKKHSDKIVRFVTMRQGSVEDAEDVLQEGITSLVLNVRKGSFQGASSVSTYLFAICKNIWHKKFKKLERVDSMENKMLPGDETMPGPDVEVISDERRDLIMSLFDHLKSKCKEVLYLWALSYSMKEIAREMEYKSDQAAMNKKNLCLKELHSRIQTDSSMQKIIHELI